MRIHRPSCGSMICSASIADARGSCVPSYFHFGSFPRFIMSIACSSVHPIAYGSTKGRSRGR